MTKIIITVDNKNVIGYSDATEAAPEYDRKTVAIIMAAMDAVSKALEGSGDMEAVRSLIAPTIKQRAVEAGVLE